ncbi:MAG: amidase [Castellaniella sp.]|uniref:amidase n=1 Tax=Castellaniella sp. TaxID=1955812 RepID=UPI0012267A22|nr:amidase [Castellaniella sp.]TAN30038.1 MAG: amidase [Castellaniella sp.]
MTLSGDSPDWSITQQSEALASGHLSAVELIGAYLERIDALDGKLHAYVEVYATEARLAAEAADKARRSGHALGPLHGIPIALKDLADIEGRITTGGCALWKNRRSKVTATLVRRLIAQGMIVLGKTHMVEFAFGGWGTNTGMGTPWNPWDLQQARTPGGSSSGSGVAVAARLAPWALGTDTGGSVRLPASLCGITGLKTSAGRISNYGVLPLSQTLDTPGPMGATAKDVAQLYLVMQGPDPLDRRTLGLPPELTLRTLHKGVAGLRLARMPDSEREGVSSPVLAAYDRSLDELSRLGAEIVSLRLPVSFSDVAALNGRIMAAESYALLADTVDDVDLALDEDVRPRILAGRGITAYDYLRALARRNQMIDEFDHALAEVDALLTPTTATTAIPLTQVDQGNAPSRFTRFANFLDLCAIAMPNGADENGLPTSLHVMCRRYDEAMALRIGCAYQKATDWHMRRPVLDTHFAH